MAPSQVRRRPASAAPPAQGSHRPKRARVAAKGRGQGIGSQGVGPVGCAPVACLNPRGKDSKGNGRKVLVLYTGGTMGMMPQKNGSLAPVPGMLAKRLLLLEELQQDRMPEVYLLEFIPLLDSADMAPKDWTKIANVLGHNYYEYDGFVVLHGTDTLAYTASALSFMLEQLAKPVIVTGSQLPFSEPVSDARQNFLGSVVFAGLADICEVCVYFCGKLLRGNRSQKLNASALAAFGSPNFPPLGEQGTDIRIFTRRVMDPPKGRFRVSEIDVTDFIVLWVIPGFSDEVLKPLLLSKTVKGIVLLLYGCGNAPARKASFVKILGELVQKGVVVVACSQCLQGTVVLEKYAVGKAFADAGVVSARDMTTEAAVTKMAYLFSKGLTSQECRDRMGEDLRGELSTATTTINISEPITGIKTM